MCCHGNDNHLASRLKHEADSAESEVTNNHSRENSIPEDIVLESVNHKAEGHVLGDAPPIKEVSMEKAESQSVPVLAAISNRVKVNPKVRWQKIAEKCTNSCASGSVEKPSEERRAARQSLFLHEGEGHVVWKPRDRLRLALVVGQVLDMPRTLSERRVNLEKRVQATRAVLRADSKNVNIIEQHPPCTRRHMTFKDAAKKVKSDLHNSEHYHFHDVVSQYMARMRMRVEQGSSDNTSSQLTLSELRQSNTAPTHVDETPPTLPSEDEFLVGSFPENPSLIDVGDISQCVVDVSPSHDTSQCVVESPSHDTSQDSLVKHLAPVSPAKNQFTKPSKLAASRKMTPVHKRNHTAVEGILHESWC